MHNGQSAEGYGIVISPAEDGQCAYGKNAMLLDIDRTYITLCLRLIITPITFVCCVLTCKT